MVAIHVAVYYALQRNTYVVRLPRQSFLLAFVPQGSVFCDKWLSLMIKTQSCIQQYNCQSKLKCAGATVAEKLSNFISASRTRGIAKTRWQVIKLLCAICTYHAGERQPYPLNPKTIHKREREKKRGGGDAADSLRNCSLSTSVE